MSYKKSDGKMKEGHKHTNHHGETWMVKDCGFVRVEYDPKAIRL